MTVSRELSRYDMLDLVGMQEVMLEGGVTSPVAE
jgi:hypothetical protein